MSESFLERAERRRAKKRRQNAIAISVFVAVAAATGLGVWYVSASAMANRIERNEAMLREHAKNCDNLTKEYDRVIEAHGSNTEMLLDKLAGDRGVDTWRARVRKTRTRLEKLLSGDDRREVSKTILDATTESELQLMRTIATINLRKRFKGISFDPAALP